jgi:hypothetical protein
MRCFASAPSWFGTSLNLDTNNPSIGSFKDVVDRSARAGGLGSSEKLLLVHARRGSFAVPGFTIVPRPGAGPTQGDIPLPNGLFLASEARTMLESLAKPGGNRLDQIAVEDWIDELCSRGGERRINAVRDWPD